MSPHLDRIYLDYNASAPLSFGVKDVVADALESVGNPSSIHSAGKKAKSILNKTRHILASHMDASPPCFIFTSGGTEANALALKGLDIDVILVSAIEHTSVYAIAQDRSDVLFKEIPVTPEGIVNLEALKKMLDALQGKKVLVSVMMANNESGTLQPIAEINEIMRFYNGFFHVDAVQAFGKIPISLKDLPVDLMSFSSHKIGGCMGVGALYIREGISLKALYRGGGQEHRMRSGTENVPGIAGFGKALENITFSQWEKVRRHRDFLEVCLQEKMQEERDDFYIASQRVPRLPNTSLIARPKLLSETQVIHLDLKGICVSSGAACSSGVVKKSRVLHAMGMKEDYQKSAIRVSLGPTTTSGEIEKFIATYCHLG